jgi:hypothetical protein
MGNIRSAAGLVAAFVFLSAAFIDNCAAQAQATGTASDGKRVQVLRIVEVGSTSSVKKAKSAATAVKKKVVSRDPVRHTQPTARDAAQKQVTSTDPPAENTSAIDGIVAPERNGVAAEQTGILSFGNRAIAFAAFPGEGDNIELPVGGAAETPASSGPNISNPTLIADEAVGQLGGSSSPVAQVLATLSGAMVAGGFGWYVMITSSRRRDSRHFSRNGRDQLG